MLSVWLQSVYNHGVLQQSPSLLAFVTGGGPKTDRDSLGLYRDGNISSNGTSLPRGREEKGSSSAFVAEECEKRLAFLSPPQPPPEVFSSIQFARELAQRDVATIHRAVSRLEVDFSHVIEASKRLSRAFQDKSKAFYGVGHACNVQASIEESLGNHQENVSWREINSALTFDAPMQAKCAFAVNTEIVDFVCLLSASIPTAKASLESTKASMAIQSLDEADKYLIAVNAAKEFDAAKRSRQLLLAERLSSVCRGMAEAHACSSSRWEQTKTALLANDPSSSSGEKETNLLRQLMEEQVGGLDKTLNTLQDAFTEKREMQDAFVALSSALRSNNNINGASRGATDLLRETTAHKALLKRPVVPPGTRREPTLAELGAEYAARASTGTLRGSIAEDAPRPSKDGSWDVFDDCGGTRNSQHSPTPEDEGHHADDGDGVPPPPPKKASFGWSDLLWRGGGGGGGGGGGTAAVATPAARAPIAAVIEEHRPSLDGPPDDLQEDTPMNRALKQREDELQRRRHEEERKVRGQLDDASRREAGAIDEIYERRTRRAAPHSGSAAPSQRRAAAKLAIVASNDLYVPSPKPALSLRPVHGHSDQANQYFERVPTGPVQAAAAAAAVAAAASQASHQSQPTPTKPQPPRNSGPITVNEADLPAFAPSSSFSSSSSSFSPVAAAALPPGWEAVRTEEGSVYYYHKTTRVSRWDFPSAQVQAALEERLKESQRQQDEAVAKRREERDAIKRARDEQQQAAERLQTVVKKTIMQWKQPTGPGKPRPFYDLLNTLHTVTDVVQEGEIVRTPLTEASTSSELKRAYFAASRKLHPDKLTSATIEQKIMAEAVFTVLTEERDKIPT